MKLLTKYFSVIAYAFASFEKRLLPSKRNPILQPLSHLQRAETFYQPLKLSINPSEKSFIKASLYESFSQTPIDINKYITASIIDKSLATTYDKLCIASKPSFDNYQQQPYLSSFNDLEFDYGPTYCPSNPLFEYVKLLPIPVKTQLANGAFTIKPKKPPKDDGPRLFIHYTTAKDKEAPHLTVFKDLWPRLGHSPLHITKETVWQNDGYRMKRKTHDFYAFELNISSNLLSPRFLFSRTTIDGMKDIHKKDPMSGKSIPSPEYLKCEEVLSFEAPTIDTALINDFVVFINNAIKRGDITLSDEIKKHLSPFEFINPLTIWNTQELDEVISTQIEEIKILIDTLSTRETSDEFSEEDFHKKFAEIEKEIAKVEDVLKYERAGGHREKIPLMRESLKNCHAMFEDRIHAKPPYTAPILLSCLTEHKPARRPLLTQICA